MRKAERGEKIEYAALRDHKRTAELRDKQKPQVDSKESAVLLDIIRKGGMGVDDRNFASIAEKQAFLEKFSLGFYDRKVEEALARVHDDDPKWWKWLTPRPHPTGHGWRKLAGNTCPPNGTPKGVMPWQGG